MNTIQEGMRFSRLLEQAIEDHKVAIQKAADAERVYRKAISEKRIESIDQDFKYAADVTAWVDSQTADLRYERDIAEKNEKNMLEYIRNLRQQLSFIQSAMKNGSETYEAVMSGQSGG